MRCLTLADALREKGAECQFICREHDGHMMDHIHSCGYKVHVLPKTDKNVSVGSSLAHAKWLGVDWSTDLHQTRRLLGASEFDWLIVDNYSLDQRWESAMRPACKGIMVIDDLADRHHDCDLLLDQNYGSSAERYAGLVPDKCIQFHGPEFALLKTIYAQRRAQQSVRSGKIKRMLIYFGGGADPFNLAGMAMRAFLVPELSKIELNIVIGTNHAHKEQLESIVEVRGRTFIHSQLPDLSELISKADLALGAGGGTAWERCCLGLPSIVISIADNQRPACEALVKDGFIHYLGHVGECNTEVICEHILEFLGQPEKLVEISEKCMRLVDGRGTGRVTKTLMRQMVFKMPTK